MTAPDTHAVNVMNLDGAVCSCGVRGCGAWSTGMFRDQDMTDTVGQPAFARPEPAGRGTLDECPNGCGTACDCPDDDPECE